MTDRPNLFEFATSELSQDAFLCWLLSWAAPACRDTDPRLYAVGCEFVRALVTSAKLEAPAEIASIAVFRQELNIDVHAIVNGELVILIEDKTDTAEHSNQLQTYVERLSAKYGGHQLIPVYLKTGDQADLSAPENAGYSCFKRANLLRVLEDGFTSGVTSDIYRDFLERLRAREAEFQSFRTLPPSEWGTSRSRWAGFFSELQPKLSGSWGYVPNPSGGFMAFWWHGRNGAYLQLEETRLCFKLWEPKVDERRARRDSLRKRVLGLGQQFGFELESSGRLGQSMTVAALKAGEDYRSKDSAGLLDVAATCEVLHRAEALLDAATRSE